MATSMKIARLTAGKVDYLLTKGVLTRNVVTRTPSQVCLSSAYQPHVAGQYHNQTARPSQRKWMKIYTLNSSGPHQTYCSTTTDSQDKTLSEKDTEADKTNVEAEAATNTDETAKAADKPDELKQAEATSVASDSEKLSESLDKSSEIKLTDTTQVASGTDHSSEVSGESDELAPMLKDTEKTTTIIEDSDELDILYKKLILEVKGHDRKVLYSYETFVRQTAKQMQLNLAKVTAPKVNIFRQSVLASAHVYKKHQVQYEERTYYRVFEFKHLTGSTADTLLEYVQRNLPEGTAMKVTKHQVLPMPAHLRPPTQRKQLQS